MEMRPCLNCGKSFKADKKTRKFCGKPCDSQYMWTKGTRSHQKGRKFYEGICEECGKLYKFIWKGRIGKTRYCSLRCSGIAMQRVWAHDLGTVDVICHNCHKPWPVNRRVAKNAKFCSSRCRNLARKSHPNKHRPILKALDRLNKCNRCGYRKFPQILEVNHIDHNSGNNAPENLEAVCPNCHSLVHRKLLSQYPV